MEKIKIFLVEDEIIIRNGIKNGIEWEKEGFEFVGEASDGELAYPMILKEKPDILITDIKMPFMDGLELSRLVKRELPNLKILILSGYDEFEYAKEAIRLGVTEYLLKPISASKLLESLHGVSRLIKQEKEEKQLLKKYSEEMRENTEHEKMKFFGQLISGNFSMAEVIETGKRYGINLSAQVYEVILFKIINAVGRRTQSLEIIEACESLEQMVAKTPYVYCFQRGVDGWAFLLTAEDEEQMEFKTKRFTDRIKNLMSQWENLEYFGGIGRHVLRVRELRQSFSDADYAFSGRFVNAPNQILKMDEIKNAKTLENFEVRSFGEMERTRETIEKFLNNGTHEEIDSFTKVYINEIPVENLKSTLMRQYIIMDMYIVIMSFCEKLEISDEKFEAEAEEFKETVQTIYTSDEIRSYMNRLLEKALELRDKASGRRYSDIINGVGGAPV